MIYQHVAMDIIPRQASDISERNSQSKDREQENIIKDVQKLRYERRTPDNVSHIIQR